MLQFIEISFQFGFRSFASRVVFLFALVALTSVNNFRIDQFSAVLTMAFVTRSPLSTIGALYFFAGQDSR